MCDLLLEYFIKKHRKNYCEKCKYYFSNNNKKCKGTHFEQENYCTFEEGEWLNET